HAATELGEIGAQHGDIQVQPTRSYGQGPSDAVLTVDATMEGLLLISGTNAKHWGDITVAGHLGNLWASQVPNFGNQMLLPIVWGRLGSWGSNKGLIMAERKRLGTDHANAVVDLLHWSAQRYSNVEEVHANLSARFSGLEAQAACGTRRRRVSEMRPPLGEGRQMNPHARPKPAQLRGYINRIV
ncbi:helicase-like protein, partial [Trypanosoma cruzi]